MPNWKLKFEARPCTMRLDEVIGLCRRHNRATACLAGDQACFCHGPEFGKERQFVLFIKFHHGLNEPSLCCFFLYGGGFELLNLSRGQTKQKYLSISLLFIPCATAAASSSSAALIAPTKLLRRIATVTCISSSKHHGGSDSSPFNTIRGVCGGEEEEGREEDS